MRPRTPFFLPTQLFLPFLPWLLLACSPQGAANPPEGEPTSTQSPPEPTVPQQAYLNPPAATEDIAEAFRQELAAKAEQAFETGELVVPGTDGWLFFAPELRSLSVGEFWGESAAAASRAPRADAQDPLPAILDFRDQLAERGVELLFVPVPTKAAVYPRHVSEAVRDAYETGQPPRLDLAHGEFLERLRQEGVRTLDLLPLYSKEWAEGDERLYCRQDTHWSGRGLELAAEAIADEIGSETGQPDWLDAARGRAPAPPPTAAGTREVTITGDLWRDLQLPDDEKPPKETLPLTFVEGFEPWRESPVLLLGDSHVLVFSAGGDLHAEGAGLPEHLSRELSLPVDLIGVRGSGATPARVNLLRRGDGLAGKRVVVWVLSVREYTEGQGWQKVPIAPP